MSLELHALLEAALFSIGRPVSPSELASALGVPQREVLRSLEVLKESLVVRGIRLTEHDNQWQMVAAPEAHGVIERLAGIPAPPRLSSAALEALAIVAYQQPVTRAQVETVRGVDCSGVLGSLIERNLIEEVGRSEGPGRPRLYGTTLEFLRAFGLSSITDLPPLTEIESASQP